MKVNGSPLFFCSHLAYYLMKLKAAIAVEARLGHTRTSEQIIVYCFDSVDPVFKLFLCRPL